MKKSELNTIKISSACISWVKAKMTKNDRAGGPMPRLLMKPSDIQRDFFQSIEHWSVAIATDWGVLPTRFWVRPRNYGTVGHNVFIREGSTFEDRIIPPDICVNFDLRKSIKDVIEYYCPEWDLGSTGYKRVDHELKTDIILMKDRFSGRGLLVLVNPMSKKSLDELSYSNHNQNKALMNSFSFHLSKMKLYENVDEFIDRWKFFIEQSTKLSKDERDLEQKRDDLERLGFKCYFYRRKGIDSAATKIRLYPNSGEPIEFNIDVESKFDAANFFKSSEAGDSVKYPRLPIIVLCHQDNSNEPPSQYFAHHVICLDQVMTDLKKTLVKMLPILESTQEEIDRLTVILAEEKNILAKERKSVKLLKKRKKKQVA